MKLDDLQKKLLDKKAKEGEIKAKYAELKKKKKLTTAQRLDRIEELLGITQ